jgi:hypothetical protein
VLNVARLARGEDPFGSSVPIRAKAANGMSQLSPLAGRRQGGVVTEFAQDLAVRGSKSQ